MLNTVMMVALLIIGILIGVFGSIFVMDLRPLVHMYISKSILEDENDGYIYKIEKLDLKRDLDILTRRHWGVIKIHTIKSADISSASIED